MPVPLAGPRHRAGPTLNQTHGTVDVLRPVTTYNIETPRIVLEGIRAIGCYNDHIFASDLDRIITRCVIYAVIGVTRGLFIQ